MLPLQAPDVYQGDDWLTYRATAAKAFDTLDHLDGLCQPHPAASDVEEALLLGEIAGLCDDLTGDLDAVLADIFPHARFDAQHRWMGFEMQLHLNALRDEMRKEQASLSAEDLEGIRSRAFRIRELLKQIDQ